jgi:hypothetical protein
MGYGPPVRIYSGQSTSTIRPQELQGSQMTLQTAALQVTRQLENHFIASFGQRPQIRFEMTRKQEKTIVIIVKRATIIPKTSMINS